MATLGDRHCSQQKVDFFIALPVELVFHIILYLELKHVLPCVRVSKSWYHILSGMEYYWKLACRELGLSKELLAKFLLHSASPKSVVVAVLRHRRSICDFPPSYGESSSGLTYNMHYTCQYAQGPKLVGTVYKDFKPHQMLVQSVREDTVDVTHTLRVRFSRIAENRVVWAHLYRDRFLFSASASGVWCVYDVTTTPTPVQWRTEPMYDPETRIACCDECGMICSAKIVCTGLSGLSERALWELRVMEIIKKPFQNSKKGWSLPLPVVTKFTLDVNSKDISYRRAAFGKKRIALLSHLKEKNEQGFCMSHLVLLQWANDITGYIASYRTERSENILRLTPTPVKNFTVEYTGKDLLEAISKNHGLNTEFVLSEDNTLIGMIFRSCLLTWDMQLSSTNPSSFAEITLDSYQYEEMRLVSLGHVYSIVGLEFGGCVLVVGTRTGEQLLKCAGFAENHCYLHPPYISFFSVIEQRWQSDISQPCKTKVMYWNKTKGTVEWVQLGVATSSSPSMNQTVVNESRRKRWWHRK